jgi:hypothetical protein
MYLALDGFYQPLINRSAKKWVNVKR